MSPAIGGRKFIVVEIIMTKSTDAFAHSSIAGYIRNVIYHIFSPCKSNHQFSNIGFTCPNSPNIGLTITSHSIFTSSHCSIKSSHSINLKPVTKLSNLLMINIYLCVYIYIHTFIYIYIHIYILYPYIYIHYIYPYIYNISIYIYMSRLAY